MNKVFQNSLSMAEVVTPEGKLDLSAAARLHSELGALRAQDIEVDLTHATSIGALCLQVLIAGCKTARDGNKTFRITGTNDRIDSNLAVMGMAAARLTEDFT